MAELDSTQAFGATPHKPDNLSPNNLSISASTPVNDDIENTIGSSATESGHLGHGTGASSLNGPTTTSASIHSKKFASSNINRKFLEKTTSGSTNIPAAVQSAASKGGLSTPKPTLTTNPSHSRLVTTKLTAGPQPSVVTGPGWSRSQTGTPSPAPPNGAPTSSQAASSAATSGVSPAPVSGKLIQPTRPSTVINSGPSKPAWRTAKPGTVGGPSRISDFPTVGELAKEREEMEANALRATESKAARQEELQQQADAFRGVHLDPKAHHWDEMIEDDSFLDGVLEFGDGKQYTVTPSLQTVFQLGGSTAPEAETTPVPVPKEVSADDFDRSWPHSSQVAQHAQRSRDLPPHTTASGASTVPRTLFNERSNRMEPVPVSKAVVPNRWKGEDVPVGFIKRGISVSQPGVERHLPPHMSQSGMQVLKKPPIVNSASPTDERSGMTSPRSPIQPTLSSRQAPLHLNKQATDAALASTRPDLEHRSGVTEPPILVPRRPDPPSRQFVRRPSVAIPKDTPGHALLPATPTPTTTAVSKETPSEPAPHVEILPQTPTEPVLSYEEASKTMMQISAERARQRRQMEEDERIKAQERARQKAADLEREIAQKVPLSESVNSHNGATVNTIKDCDVMTVLEDAQKIVESRTPSSSTVVPSVIPPNRPQLTSQLSSVSPQPYSARRPSLHTAPSTSETGSWRNRGPLPERVPRPTLTTRRDSDASTTPSVHPKTEQKGLVSHQPGRSPVELRPPLGTQPSHSQRTHPMSPANDGPSTSKGSNPYIGVVASVEIGKDEVLEEIDFQDLGRLVGAPSHGPEHETPSGHTLSHPPRIDQPAAPIPIPKPEGSSWRRAPIAESQNIPRLQALVPSNAAGDNPIPHSVGSSRPTDGPNDIPVPVEQQPDHPQLSLKSPRRATAPLRSPRSPTFREAPMSTLDYTISRIRGAIDGMHAEEDNKARITETQTLTQDRPNRTVAPRPAYVPIPTELPVTSVEAPHSPKPAWNTVKLSLPKHAPKGALHGKQVRFLREEPGLVSFDILSWNPPVAGMSRRTFSLNAVLFPRTFKNGQIQYSVNVPSSRKAVPLPSTEEESREWKPVVKLPPRVNDLRAPSVPIVRITSTISDVALGLETVSRSPPPDHNSTKAPELHTEGKDLANQPRSRSQPRMPEGSGIAFYRTPNSDTAQPSGVSFIVNSELGVVPNASRIENGVPLTSLSPAPMSNASTSAVHAPMLAHASSGSSMSSKTSPVKELAHRLPDPEHLRAVWSQMSNSSDIPTANSLRGIADDLTALPFTLHEVKSEDGGTPPPGTVPSRMSIHDVTRAFQQVPAGSSGSPSHAPISPPSNVQALRRPSYGFPSPSTSSGSRPLYPAYHPQAMGSPAPAMAYPAHVTPGMARPMIPTSHSGQPQSGMWVQVGHPSGPTTPIGAMQYMPTPYSPQVLGYGNMSMHPGMYMQQMPASAGTPAANPPPHHGHGMPPPLAPVITQPVQGYPTNPYQPYPSPVTPGGRGVLPSNAHSSMSPRQTTHTHPAPYNPVPATYGRAPW